MNDQATLHEISAPKTSDCSLRATERRTLGKSGEGTRSPIDVLMNEGVWLKTPPARLCPWNLRVGGWLWVEVNAVIVSS